MPVSSELEEGIRFFGIGVTGGCELPCGFLGIEPVSSGRVARAHNCFGISSALH